jgi:hypothetical protein
MQAKVSAAGYSSCRKEVQGPCPAWGYMDRAAYSAYQSQRQKRQGACSRLAYNTCMFMKSCPEASFVILQKGMSPVKQVLQENHVKPATPSGSASEVPAWFATYKQEADQKFAKQEHINEQQGKEIKQQSEEFQRLSRTVHGYEDIEVRKLKESGRSKILAALKIKQMPHHWNTFVGALSGKQVAKLKENGISHQAVLATSYDHYQKRGNEAAHDPVAEVVANAIMALPKADKIRFIELFNVVFGGGVYESIVQGWTLQA